MKHEKTKEKVLDIIAENFCISNQEIARKMKMSYTTIFLITRDLLKEGEISKGVRNTIRRSGSEGTVKGFILE